jgi:hypothetical protein
MFKLFERQHDSRLEELHRDPIGKHDFTNQITNTSTSADRFRYGCIRMQQGQSKNKKLALSRRPDRNNSSAKAATKEITMKNIQEYHVESFSSYEEQDLFEQNMAFQRDRESIESSKEYMIALMDEAMHLGYCDHEDILCEIFFN